MNFSLILLSYLSQLAMTIGIIFVFGFLIAFCRRGVSAVGGNAGRRTLLITGIIGTPVHEFSHALMCLIFAHKIDEIKLYDPMSEDGTLGYVKHSYNPKNIYQQIGNFFIGIAPITCGGGILLLLMWLMVPDTFFSVVHELSSVSAGSLGITTLFSYLIALWRVILVIFSFGNLGNPLWWIYILIAIMISSHMELSFADIKGSVLGFLILAVLLFITNLIFGIFGEVPLNFLTGIVGYFGISLASFLTLSLVFSLLLLSIVLIIRGVVKLIFKK